MKLRIVSLVAIILVCLMTTSVAAYDFTSTCPGTYHPNGRYTLEDPYCSDWAAPVQQGNCVFAAHYQLCEVDVYKNYTGFHCSYHFNNTMVPGTDLHYERITHTDGHGVVVIDNTECCPY